MDRGLGIFFPPKPLVCAVWWRIAQNLLLQLLEFLQTLGWGHPGWGASKRWGRDRLCMGMLAETLRVGLPELGAGALPPTPPQR